jgi:Protein of unknown function (DUF3604)
MRINWLLRAAFSASLTSYFCQPLALADQTSASVSVSPLRDAYYGDLHLHTSYSLDAYVFLGTKVDPDEAYRFARGDTVEYLGQSARRREPLDFLAVTDHAENMGVLDELEDPNSVVSKSAMGRTLSRTLKAATLPDGTRDDNYTMPVVEAYGVGNGVGQANPLPPKLQQQSIAAWQREMNFANQYYQPGRFTTFIAYEWTSMGADANEKGYSIHRNVIFKGNSAPYPFSSFDSRKPEDLWTWLEKIRAQGYEALAIPHNGNVSNGLMYDWVQSDGRPIDQAYAQERQANEPLSEISQIKGTSETHPLLSPSDEFASYETLDRISMSEAAGSFLRDALSRGLVLERKVGANPYKYGFVGGSDFHGGLSVSSQADVNGSQRPNIGGGRKTKAEAAAVLSGTDFASKFLRTLTAGNLTGVWAESNTRESIYAALRRRETFATTGTRLRFRFFGGWSYDNNLLRRKDWVAAAYAKGVPMGGDLPAKPPKATPRFAIWAVKDPNSGNLDRVQIIKVWEKDGQQQEKVFDVAWSRQRSPDPRTGKLPVVGNTVNLKTGDYTNDIGAAELKAVWTDPEFDPQSFAAYYLRILEIPTPRWSTLLGVQNGLPLPSDVPATEQQRGWSSPIWYTPTVH